MIARLTGAVALAAFVTLSLLYAMQQMIATGKETQDTTSEADAEPFRLADIIRYDAADASLGERATKPARPRQPAMRPASLERVEPGREPVDLVLDVFVPELNGRPDSPRRLATAGDSDIRPILHVAPAYPAVAILRSIEGHVLLEFTVTTDGGVRDITVLESTAPVLEASAIKAALQFEFKPRVIDGEPIEVTGVRNRIVFILTEPPSSPVPL